MRFVTLNGDLNGTLLLSDGSHANLTFLPTGLHLQREAAAAYLNCSNLCVHNRTVALSILAPRASWSWVGGICSAAIKPPVIAKVPESALLLFFLFFPFLLFSFFLLSLSSSSSSLSSCSSFSSSPSSFSSLRSRFRRRPQKTHPL